MRSPQIEKGAGRRLYPYIVANSPPQRSQYHSVG